MKCLLIIVLAGLLTAPAFTQEDSITVINTGIVSIKEEPGDTEIIVGQNGSAVIDENQDTTRIKLGKKGIIIIEGDKETQVKIKDLEEVEEWEQDVENENEAQPETEETENEKVKFKPHWAGLEVGINNYVNNNMSLSLANSMSFMDLNTGRSWNFNINFLDYGFGLCTDKIGLVTGLGLEWNNYHFDDNNNIQKVDGVIESLLLPYPDIKKNKLQTTYLRAPLLLEFQIPAGEKRIYLSAGPVIGVKLGSNTKIVYKENGDEQKIKDKDDYNISPIRYGFTARAGYRSLRIFANYYITPLFETGKGPELYPFSIGLTLVDF